MDFPSPSSFPTEAALAFQHAERILDALRDGSTSVLQSVVIWVAGDDKLELGRHAWNAYTQVSILLISLKRHRPKSDEQTFKRGDTEIPAIIVAAKSLPKGAMIEVQVLAHSNNAQPTESESDDDNPSLEKTPVSTDNDFQLDYECKVRRVRDTSSFGLVLVNNGGKY
jgi:diphthine-ammonia ligase